MEHNLWVTKPMFCFGWGTEWKTETEIRIYICIQRQRESTWLFDLIPYKTRQPINNVFDKSATMFAIYDQKKNPERNVAWIYIYIYIEKRVNLPSCEFDAICKTSQP